MNLPAVFMPAGPMLRGNWRGNTLGSGSDSWKYWAELRAGNIDEQAWSEIEEGIARSAGHCMTMGTASTMTSLAETLGLTLPGAASIPAVDANHSRMAEVSRPPRGRNGLGRSQAARHPHARVIRQRDRRAHGAGRLDQRHRAPGRDGGPRGDHAGSGSLRRDLARRFRCSPICAPPANT